MSDEVPHLDTVKNSESLKEWIRRAAPKVRFRPIPLKNRLGNQIEWYWSDERAYSETVMVDGVAVGHLKRSMKTKEVVGVTIFLEAVK